MNEVCICKVLVEVLRRRNYYISRARVAETHGPILRAASCTVGPGLGRGWAGGWAGNSLRLGSGILQKYRV